MDPLTACNVISVFLYSIYQEQRGKTKINFWRNHITLGEKIKSIRKQAGMSPEQLSEKLGVSRQAVTK
ncbi:helix-turn-helix domain-containing protein [Parablautia intestinalis]|uniref:helix-turn-helix domain-containing protein n=1 Tax=Parablautia intestinalis TaxID=2320100 RepID=UPI0024127444|nr:helix-turn-helix transcriptional regulator [Parablautia intestinalis]